MASSTRMAPQKFIHLCAGKAHTRLGVAQFTRSGASKTLDFPELSLPPEQETRSPEELEALRKRAEKEVRSALGSAIELVEIGDVVSYEFLEKELAIRERLDVMITRVTRNWRIYERSNPCHSRPASNDSAFAEKGRIVLSVRPLVLKK